MEPSVLSIKDPSSFTFAQIAEEAIDSSLSPDHGRRQTKGELHVKPQDRSLNQKGIWVVTKVLAQNHSLANFQAIQDGNSINLFTSSSASSSSAQSCPETSIYLSSTMWISRGLDLSSFNIYADSMDIIVHDGIPIPSHTPITISAPSSSVKLLSTKLSSHLTMDSRHTTVNTQSGSVKGDFTLRDAIKIHTQSGSININLSLISSNTTSPATLDLQAHSGSIKVDTVTILTPSKIPDRDYHSTLRTNSGSIRANLVHGSSTTLQSDSSSIQASLHPHGDAARRSDLTTHVLSGSTDLTVHPSLSNSSTPLRNFHASHTAISGSIRILYPAQWEGTVAGSTVSGSIKVDWPGLKIVDNQKGWGTKSLKGVKGKGEGVVGFKDVSGSVELKGTEAVPVEEEEDGDVGRAVDNDGVEKVLTPGSEAGDEWVFVQ
ncbi:MAG: hypothetical protein Q9178_000291 [Gyalolechia marmorata]